MKINMIFRLSLAVLLLTPLAANASTYTGKITSLRYGNPSGTLSPGRIGIQVGSHGASSCSSGALATYYSLQDNNSTGVFGLWVTALLEALKEGRTVTITGSGTCDSFGVESISSFDIN